jgi:hypothetical protein
MANHQLHGRCIATAKLERRPESASIEAQLLLHAQQPAELLLTARWSLQPGRPLQQPPDRYSSTCPRLQQRQQALAAGAAAAGRPGHPSSAAAAAPPAEPAAAARAPRQKALQAGDGPALALPTRMLMAASAAPELQPPRPSPGRCQAKPEAAAARCGRRAGCNRALQATKAGSCMEAWL